MLLLRACEDREKEEREEEARLGQEMDYTILVIIHIKLWSGKGR